MNDPNLVAEWVQKAEGDFQKLNELCMKVDGSFGLISDLLETLNPFEAKTRYPGYFANINDARLAIAAMKEVRIFVRDKLGLK